MTAENQSDRTDVDKALLGHTTYRSLGEQHLSPAEERFEKGRRTIGLFLAPLITIAFLALPIDIPPNQQTLAGVLRPFSNRSSAGERCCSPRLR